MTGTGGTRNSKNMTEQNTHDATAGAENNVVQRRSCEMVDLAESALPRELQGHLGKHLRAHYSELIQAPVPQKISDLLARLAATESKTKNGKGST